MEGGVNTKVSTGRVELTVPDMHTLTRESQEVVVGKILVRKVLLPDIEVALKSWISLTDIPHSGQLNITTSTLPTPVLLDIAVKSKVISAVLAVVFIVSS